MKFLLVFFALLSFSGDSFHALECEVHCDSHKAADQLFCQGLSEFSCNVHNDKCYTYEHCPTPKEPKPSQGSCYPHSPENEIFCTGLNRSSCELHDRLCFWAY